MTTATIPEKFTGLIQLAIDPSEFDQHRGLVTDDRFIPVMKTHCTLLHQSIPKTLSAGATRGDKALKGLFKSPDRPTGSVNLQFSNLYHCQDLDTGRESIVAFVENWETCEDIRNEILSAAGLDPNEVSEPQREYHVSLFNLTGNPGDSPAYPQRSVNCSPLEV
jgi:hypothetical protein